MSTSSSSSFLEWNQSQVRVPLHVVERMPAFVRKLEPRFLNALAQKDEIRVSLVNHAATSFTLPALLTVSPIVVLLKSCSEEDEKDKGAPSAFYGYVSYTQSLSQLGQLFVAVLGGLFTDLDPRVVQEAEEMWKKEGLAQQDKLVSDIESLIGAKQAPYSQEDTTMFLKLLERATVDHINRYERFLHRTLVGSQRIPEQACLTPPLLPANVTVLSGMAVDEFLDAFEQYWTLKVELLNAELQRDANVEHPKQWLTLEGIREAHTQCPPEQLWRGYLTPRTAHEYMTFFKLMQDL